MANFYDEQISHMKHLMDYGMKNESKKSQYTSVMNQKEGADGRIYGIVAEGTKYYIKSCEKGKENLTESFDYIGGFLNRKNCAYSSYADAVKDMDMRLMSLNEDHGKRMPINEMKRSADFMDESMMEMKEDIARHRQILENIDVIYQNKKGGIGDKNIGVPEAPKTTEFKTTIGGPFEDAAKYEANRDNKENAKNHEKQGGPFKEDGTVDSDDMQKADKLPTQDSNTPGDTYTKKAEYVPKNAVAAMNPGGGKVARVNESFGDHHDPGYDEDEIPEGPYDSQADMDFDSAIGEGLDAEETHFPEENPDLGAEEFGDLGDGSDGLSPEELGDGLDAGSDLEADEFLSQFDDDPDDFDSKLDDMAMPTEDGEMPAQEDLIPSDGVSSPDSQESHLAGEGEEIAGIDDMSGVDRNNLSADVIDDVVNEIVGKFSKGKKMKVISESVAKSILKEMFDEDGDDKPKPWGDDDDAWRDDDFMYFSQKQSPLPTDKYTSPKRGIDAYQGSKPQNRKNNLQPDGTYLDPRPGAPAQVNTDKVDYNPESPYFLQNKYHDDDPNVPFEESGSWIDSSDWARRFKSSLAKAAAKYKEIDVDKIFTAARHAAAVRNFGKKTLAKVLGIHPEGIEKFLTYTYKFKNVLDTGDDGELYGYRDAKALPDCIITKDGELPMSAGEGRKRFENDVKDTVVDGLGVIGPSLLAYGLPEMTNEELTELANDAQEWDETFGRKLEEEEWKLRELTPMVQKLETLPDADTNQNIADIINKWNNLIEDIAGLQSLPALIMEVDSKRGIADKQLSYDRYMAMNGRRNSGKNISGGYEEYDGSMLRNLHEDTTVLHNFGDHPGYRKKPMTTPANTEVAPNGARDWNDESTKGEEPFGKQIGSSAPYTDLVDTITKEVLKHLKGGQN